MAVREEEILRLLNQLRQSPEEFAAQGVKEALEVVPVPRLHLSTGLCAAARDVVCYLRTFGFIISHSPGENPTCAPFLARYGRLDKGPILENFAYGFTSSLDALLQILTSASPHINGSKANLRASDARVVGLATATHISERTCLVLILCRSFFDREASGGPAPALEAEFYPARIARRVAETVSDS